MDLHDLKAQLDAVNGEALQTAERNALKGVGDLFLTAVRESIDANLKHDDDTGELKAGYRARVHIATDAKVVSGDTSYVTVAPDDKVAHVARFVEDGHANKRFRGKNPKASATTPAHPFARPAFDASEEAATDLYTKTLTEAIQKALA